MKYQWDEEHLLVLEYIMLDGEKCFTPDFEKKNGIDINCFERCADDLVGLGFLRKKAWSKFGVTYNDYFWTGKEL